MRIVIIIICRGTVAMCATRHMMTTAAITSCAAMNAKNGFMPLAMELDPKILLSFRKVKSSMFVLFVEYPNYQRSDL